MTKNAVPIIGLCGNPMIQAKNLADLIGIEALADTISLIRGCVINVNTSSDNTEPTLKLTFNFEGSGRSLHFIQQCNEAIEDLLNTSSIRTFKDVIFLLEKRMPNNPYLNKVKLKARNYKDKVINFSDIKEEDGCLNLFYLYSYSSKKYTQFNSELVDFYNNIFLVFKYDIIQHMKKKLTGIHNNVTTNCANNCLTVTYKLTHNVEIDSILTSLFELLNVYDSLSTCLVNINISIKGQNDINFLLPNICKDSPEYSTLIYECDYILNCEYEEDIKLKELSEQLELIPHTKVDYFLLKGKNTESALSQPLSESNKIPAIKTMLGANLLDEDDLMWFDEDEDDLDEETETNEHRYFNRQVTDSNVQIEPAHSADSIEFDDITHSTTIAKPTINFSRLKKELIQVGLNGFKSLKVLGWGETKTEEVLERVTYNEDDTVIVDVGKQEVKMYLVDKVDLNQLPTDYPTLRKEAENRLFNEEEISNISKVFIQNNIKSVENILNNTKSSILDMCKNMTEKEISYTYFSLILSDISPELYSTIRNAVITEKFDYDIDESTPNGYLCANFKIALLNIMYKTLVTSCYKYWKQGPNVDIILSDVPNIKVIEELLNKIF